jgi:hypothetical protein
MGRQGKKHPVRTSKSLAEKEGKISSYSVGFKVKVKCQYQ